MRKIRSERWVPNTFIIGAPKAGTSSLHGWLSDHPDAFGSVEKETYFMVDPGTHMHRPEAHISRGLETWAEQFPIPDGMTPRVIIESTPGYLYYETALSHIPDLPTEPRCICILREPAAQILSIYRYFRDNWNWVPADMNFAEFLSAVRSGSHDFRGNELAQNALLNAAYMNFLPKWQERLGPDRLFVATFDELLADQAGLTRRVADWVGLDPAFYDSYGFPRENETYIPRNRMLQNVNIAVRGLLPKGRVYDTLRSMYRRTNTGKPSPVASVDAETLRQLRREYNQTNRHLAEAFDLDLSAWLDTEKV